MNAILQLKTRQSEFEKTAREILEFKKIEDDARASRLAAEALLVSMVEAKTEGTLHEEDGRIKATITFKVTRTVDAEKLNAEWNGLPPIVHDAFVWKPDLVLKHMRAIEAANPDAYAVLAKYISTKPAKPSVKIEEVA
jgi:hypothetical protein